MGYHSISRSIETSNHNDNIPSYSATVPYYYSSISHPLLQNIPNELKEVLIKSRPSISSVYENNVIDINDVLAMNANRSKFEKDEEKQNIYPLFWHIPRSGGGTISNLLGECLGLTLASSSSLYTSRRNTFYQNIFEDDSELLRNEWYEKSVFVNVNLDTKEGIERASKLGIFENIHADVMISPLIHDIPTMLFEDHTQTAINGTKIQASLFTMLRHPIEREISYFNNVKHSISVGDGGVGIMDEAIRRFEFIDWLHSVHFIDNFMVRRLVNKMEGSYKVTIDDLLSAKEVLRRKFLIGLLEEKAQSWDRIKSTYKIYWDHGHKDVNNMRTILMPTHDCENKLLSYNWPNRNQRQPLMDHDKYLRETTHDKEGKRNIDHYGWETVIDTNTYDKIRDLNEYDLMLYEYAKYLFKEQGSYFK